MEVPLAGDTRKMQVSTQRIPVGSSIGAATLIAIVLLGLFLDLPGVRSTVMVGGAVGLLLAIVLELHAFILVIQMRALDWHKHQALGLAVACDCIR